MHIQLKQVEIVEALKQFIHRQGINLAGKSVEISFTAGRKDAGTIADIEINDAVIPGTEVGDEAKGTAPVGLALVAPVAAASTDEKVREEDPQPTIDPAVPAAEKVASTSLFS